MHYLFLILAILSELAGSTLLKVSDGFTKILPTSLSLVAYFACFYFLSLALKVIPLGVSYAIWAGMGILGTMLLSFLLFHDPISMRQVIGAAVILAGVVIINL